MTVPRGIACPACGLVGTGKYCSDCGSLLRTQLPTVREMGAEVATDVLGIHGRAVATLWALLTRPGVVTEAYREGRGSQFISPVKMYVATSAPYFALLTVTAQVVVTGDHTEDLRPDVLMALTLPVFALLIKLFYGWIGGAKVLFSECVSFALTLQSAVFILSMPMLWIPDAAVILVPYAPWYIWSGARRLWNEQGVLGPVRAAGVALMYGLSIIFTAILLASLLSALA